MGTALTVLAALVAASSLTFIVLYAWRAGWWRTDTGVNQMTMAVALAALGAGTAVRWLPFGRYAIFAAAAASVVVMVWRTVIMWRATSRRNAPPEAVPPGTPPSRQWYTPTPHSVLEKHRRKDH